MTLYGLTVFITSFQSYKHSIFFFFKKKVEKPNRLKPHHPKMCFQKLKIKASSLIASYPRS